MGEHAFCFIGELNWTYAFISISAMFFPQCSDYPTANVDKTLSLAKVRSLKLNNIILSCLE